VKDSKVNRNKFTESDVQAINAYLSDIGGELSAFGKHALISQYESELADYFGFPYCHLTNSGTNALLSAFFSLHLEHGDEVLASAYTFHSSILPSMLMGAVPVLCDIDSRTGNISVESIIQNITNKTRALVITHNWGHPCNTSTIRELCAKHDLILIEDVSLSVGSTIDGQLAGSFGDITCLSLGSSKILSGGQGGAVLFKDNEMFSRSLLLSHFGARCAEEIASPLLAVHAETGFGMNNRIHVLSAVISHNRFHRLDGLIAQRHERYNLLSKYLRQTRCFNPQYKEESVFLGSWHGYWSSIKDEYLNIITPNKVCEEANEYGLELHPGGYYSPLVSRLLFQTKQEHIFAADEVVNHYRKFNKNAFPGVQDFVRRTFFFPLFLDEDLSLIDHYGKALIKIDNHLAS
jgi:perosamine synthetase